jgi:thioredoxin-like negative regulator of GroEL
MIATAENNDTRSRRARADKLQIAFNLALQATLSKLNQRNLETCFPKLARDIPEQLEAVREQTVEFIESAAKVRALMVEGARVVLSVFARSLSLYQTLYGTATE